jgi:hypothetical protein
MNEDKYTPIPGVSDTIDSLRKERDELKIKFEILKEFTERIANSYVTIANAPFTEHFVLKAQKALSETTNGGEGKI